jgi:hypothetical protein
MTRAVTGVKHWTRVQVGSAREDDSAGLGGGMHSAQPGAVLVREADDRALVEATDGLAPDRN